MNPYNLQQSLEFAGITVPNRILEAAVKHAKAIDSVARAEYKRQDAEAALKNTMNPPDTCHRCGR